MGNFRLPHIEDSKIQPTLLQFLFTRESQKIKFLPPHQFLESHDASLTPTTWFIMFLITLFSCLHRRLPNFWTEALSVFRLIITSFKLEPMSFSILYRHLHRFSHLLYSRFSSSLSSLWQFFRTLYTPVLSLSLASAYLSSFFLVSMRV